MLRTILYPSLPPTSTSPSPSHPGGEEGEEGGTEEEGEGRTPVDFPIPSTFLHLTACTSLGEVFHLPHCPTLPTCPASACPSKPPPSFPAFLPACAWKKKEGRKAEREEVSIPTPSLAFSYLPLKQLLAISGCLPIMHAFLTASAFLCCLAAFLSYAYSVSLACLLPSPLFLPCLFSLHCVAWTLTSAALRRYRTFCAALLRYQRRLYLQQRYSATTPVPCHFQRLNAGQNLVRHTILTATMACGTLCIAPYFLRSNAATRASARAADVQGGHMTRSTCAHRPQRTL